MDNNNMGIIKTAIADILDNSISHQLTNNLNRSIFEKKPIKYGKN